MIRFSVEWAERRIKVNKGQKSALLLDLAAELLKRGSWCGETHIQKAAFLLRELFGVETGQEFILYKHGPFSFDLRDTLTEMAADGLIEYVVRQPGYGPTLLPSAESLEFLERFPRTLSKHAAELKFVADIVGNKGVNELERLATAVFLTQQLPQASAENRAEELVRLKPHIPIYEAKQAIQDAEKLVAGRR